MEDCRHHVEDHSRYVLRSIPLISTLRLAANSPLAGVRQNVDELLNYSLNEKKRNFLETVELQIGLKNYDPQRDKRFSGTIKLPSVPRPGMSIWCVLQSPSSLPNPVESNGVAKFCDGLLQEIDEQGVDETKHLRG